MNILPVNTASALRTVNDGAGLLVMKKALDTLSQDGQNLVTLLQQSVSPPGLGNKIDITA